MKSVAWLGLSLDQYPLADSNAKGFQFFSSLVWIGSRLPVKFFHGHRFPAEPRSHQFVVILSANKHAKFGAIRKYLDDPREIKLTLGILGDETVPFSLLPK